MFRKTLYLAASCFTLIFSTPLLAEAKSLIVAGGCFWCVESDFEKIPGVTGAVSGYINGHTKNPTYKQVSGKKTGHYEAVKISYDDSKVTLEALTEYFWKTIDPTDCKGQFCDKGQPYLTGLFYQNKAQKTVFETSLKNLEQNKPFKESIATKILKADTFYKAEKYHQDYYTKNPLRYRFYRSSCGRDKRIKQLWGEVVSKQ